MRFLAREIGKGLGEIVSRSSDVHLLTDGKRLYLETSARQIVDITQEFGPADSWRLPQRYSAASAGRSAFGQGEYFSNYA